MPQGQRFPYVQVDPSLGSASALPYVPLTLEYGGSTVSVSGLVDSGSALNVLPYNIGRQLGASWQQQTIPVRLTGNLADCDARAILVTATVGQFTPVRLAFAWARDDKIPVILGQVNFFMEFDICFSRSQLLFEVRRRASTGGWPSDPGSASG